MGRGKLVLNSSCALSAQQVNQNNSSMSSGTTEEWLKDGGRGEVETGKPTKYSNASTTSQTFTNVFLSQVTSLAQKTQQIPPHEDFTHQLLISSQKSAFQMLYGNISSILTNNSSPIEPASSSDNLHPNPTLNTTLITHRPQHRDTMNQSEVDPSSFVTPIRTPVSKPSAYSPNLSPHPSPLRPHETDFAWKLSPAVTSHHSTAQEGDVKQIFDVMSNAWASSTRESYSARILVYHVYCDVEDIPEESRASTNQHTITAFITSLAGSYSGSTISNYVHGIRTWHILHGL